jgi:hypothetical protein
VSRLFPGEARVPANPIPKEVPDLGVKFHLNALVPKLSLIMQFSHDLST